MIIAVNDISFLWGCSNRYAAKEKLEVFSDIICEMKGDKVSNVKIPLNFMSSSCIHKGIQLAPNYTLMQALLEIKQENNERFNYLLYLLTQCGDDEMGEDIFTLGKYESKHIAKYRDYFLISLPVDSVFEDEIVVGVLNGEQKCTIKNLSNKSHLEKFWKELGIRIYELNEKHGKREYTRSGGHQVGEAPETNELGQYLLNHVVEVQGKLYAVDYEQNRIFEFRQTRENCFHAFRQKQLSKELENKIKKMSDEKYERKTC